MSILRSDVSGLYDPKKDHDNKKPAGTYADEINAIHERATRARRRKQRYGSYSSQGAQATAATVAETKRRLGESD